MEVEEEIIQNIEDTLDAQDEIIENIEDTTDEIIDNIETTLDFQDIDEGNIFIETSIPEQEERIKLQVNLNREIDTSTKSLYYPYRSEPMMLLQQWKQQSGSTLSSTAWNVLLRLVHKMIPQFPNIEQWPRNVQDIEK